MGGNWRAQVSHFELARHAKMELESFKGEINHDRLTNRLLRLGQYFDIHEVPEYAKFKIMETKLEVHALVWWQYMKLKIMETKFDGHMFLIVETHQDDTALLYAYLDGICVALEEEMYALRRGGAAFLGFQ